MAKGSISVAGKTFTFTAGDESELDALTAASAYLRTLRDKAVAAIFPDPGGLAPDPRDGPGRRAIRTYDLVTGEIFPNDPRYNNPLYGQKTEKGTVKRDKQGNITLAVKPAKFRQRGNP